MAGRLLSQVEAARVLGVDRKTLRRWTQRGIVPVFVDPDTGRPRYPEDALSAWGRGFADTVKRQAS